MSTGSSRRERRVAALLVICVALVVFWEVASRVAARPFGDLRLRAEDFDGFNPSDPEWMIRLVHMKATPTEPTVIAYDVRPRVPGMPGAPARAPVLVRLVHGYNMVDCMRIKQYRVDLVADSRQRRVGPGDRAQGGALPVQLWRLTSPSGERSVWATTMLRAVDLSATDTDTRDMAFPRVGTPDDPAWAPSGLRWSSFRRPVRNFRLSLRSKWNASRADLLTFLRLRQPAWASDVLLTLVSTYRGPSLPDTDAEAAAAAQVLDVHRRFYERFRQHGLAMAAADDR